MYKRQDQHRREGTPYNGPAPVLPPKAVVCDAQTTADLIYEFIQIYADPYEAGPLTTLGVLWGWKQPVLQRTGIPEIEYLVSVSYTHLDVYKRQVLSLQGFLR